MGYDTIDKAQRSQTVGPVTINRDSADSIHLGVYLDDPQGAGADLTAEQCKRVAEALLTVSDTSLAPAQIEYQPFPEELARRVQEASGIIYIPGSLNGGPYWLAKNCDISPITAGRYFKGTAIPTPYIARKLTLRLKWPWNDLVASILESKVGATIRNIRRKYHT